MKERAKRGGGEDDEGVMTESLISDRTAQCLLEINWKTSGVPCQVRNKLLRLGNLTILERD